MFVIHSRKDSLGSERSGGSGETSADPSARAGSGGFGCAAGLECLLGVVRALWLDSFLSSDDRSSASSGVSSSQEKKPLKGARRRKRGSSRREEQLHGISGRMFLNGASEVASLFTQQGRKGINQDAMLVWENFGSMNDTILCGVFDGHGPYGHMVAKRVRDILPLKLTSSLEGSINNSGNINPEASSTLSLHEELKDSIDFEENGECSQMLRRLEIPLLKAFRFVDRELRQYNDIDCSYSGTTAVTLIKQGDELVIGNVGDSRAVLGTRDQNNSLIAIQLTVDLKPNLPGEAERIRKCRGRVFALREEPDVTRVWLPDKDMPGLAMARALGDFILKDYGLSSVPEISYRHITERDEFVVLATDGVWDVLSNQQVVDIVASAPDRSSAAHLLVESAVKAWKVKYPTSRIDDCAAVCLFLDVNPPPISDNHTPNGVEESLISTRPDCDERQRSSPVETDANCLHLPIEDPEFSSSENQELPSNK
ncbi:probable protein phosphatase 2C 33 [Zingiber officinale]|uniref:probable protein phosphatase 2C 33 n=1 Tax=Zingiber officinale TaxID=94328 RepID=UPI001C4C4A53|nr:probable protein phosphatase 2C 33 [Zingiber officinale]